MDPAGFANAGRLRQNGVEGGVATARKRKASPRKKTTARSPRRRTQPPVRRWPRWLRLAGIVLAGVGFAAGFISASYIVHLDRIVVARFTGRHFRVPSRVYAAPTILYPGLDTELVDLRGTLDRLGYRAAVETRDLPAGRFVWTPGRIRIHLRAFAHPTRGLVDAYVMFRAL